MSVFGYTVLRMTPGELRSMKIEKLKSNFLVDLCRGIFYQWSIIVLIFPQVRYKQRFVNRFCSGSFISHVVHNAVLGNFVR